MGELLLDGEQLPSYSEKPGGDLYENSGQRGNKDPWQNLHGELARVMKKESETE